MSAVHNAFSLMPTAPQNDLATRQMVNRLVVSLVVLIAKTVRDEMTRRGLKWEAVPGAAERGDNSATTKVAVLPRASAAAGNRLRPPAIPLPAIPGLNRPPVTGPGRTPVHVGTKAVAAPLSKPAPVAADRRQNTSGSDQLFSWRKIEVKLADGTTQTAEAAAKTVDEIMQDKCSISDKVARLKELFGADKVSGSDSGGHGNMIIIRGTPICVKFGENGKKGTESEKYRIGLAYRKLFDAFSKEKDKNSSLTVAGFIDAIDHNGPYLKLHSAMELLTTRYDESTIKNYLRTCVDYGPSDDMNAFGVGEYDAKAPWYKFWKSYEGKENYVIMKSAFYGDDGKPVTGVDLELKAGNILASKTEAVVNGGKFGGWKNLKVIGGLSSIWEGIKAWWRGEDTARLPDGKNAHLVSKKAITDPTEGALMTLPGKGTSVQRDAAAKTDAITSAYLKTLSREQLEHLKKSIEAHKARAEASGDAFIGSGYMIVFPTGRDKATAKPVVTHIDYAHWMPRKLPTDFRRSGEMKGYTSESYRETQKEVLDGNIKALTEMRALVQGALNEKNVNVAKAAA